MKINGGSNGPLRPDATNRVEDRALGPNKTDTNAMRTDTVEISDAGRARAAEATVGSDPRSARFQAIRDRILQGAYDTDEVVGEVARRILDRGDLQPSPPSETQ